ncbi:MAG: pantetheine-phosphate adenylyltransferase [Phycisphaerales bacterium]|jgi:pantetheine-phosphate adenylyltransferase|nr:pantetheine-phosphate adenylyltransferase [Phycisphaerales bacterium]MBT7171738.1 pantetheine-phosphate adenylyltransferase [Phycisphaerales bacterium]
MSDNAKPNQIALFPGTFDPVTLGHMDIITRAAELFEHLIVAVGHNPDKKTMLSLHQRIQILQDTTRDHPNVSVESYSGLTIEFAKQVDATVIVRGLRNTIDMEYEAQMALANRALGGFETCFLLTDPCHAHLSSSLVRQIASMGGDISPLVPKVAVEHIRHPLFDRNR